jgi:hypothetical protein
MLLLTLDQLQHNSGLGSFLLEEPYIPAPHLEGFWIKQISKFLKQIDGSLTIADLAIQPLQCEATRLLHHGCSSLAFRFFSLRYPSDQLLSALSPDSHNI